MNPFIIAVSNYIYIYIYIIFVVSLNVYFNIMININYLYFEKLFSPFKIDDSN